MKELLKLQSMLESVKDTDDVPLELLNEINEVLQYALGWCHGWLADVRNYSCVYTTKKRTHGNQSAGLCGGLKLANLKKMK